MDHRLTEQAFRDAASKFASGVTVVTSTDGRHVAGITVSAFSSISLNPLLVMISIGHDTGVHDFIRDNRVFAVNVLSESQVELSDRFSDDSRDKIVTRFADLSTRTAATGCPIIEGTIAFFDCRIVDQFIVADHTLFIGRVEAAGHDRGRPLLYWSRGYRRVEPVSD